MAGAEIDSAEIDEASTFSKVKVKKKLRMLGENWLQVIAFSVNSKFQQYAGLLSTSIMQTNSALVLTSLGFQSAGLLCVFKMSS